MANSNVTTTLSGVSRRTMLAGLAALPSAAVASNLAASAPRTAFAVKRDAYILAKAAYSQVDEPYHLASKMAEPFRLAWLEARQKKESLQANLKRLESLRSISDVELDALADGLRAARSAGIPVDDSVIERARCVMRSAGEMVMRHPEMVEAVERERVAMEALENIKQSIGYYPLSAVVEEAGDRLLVAQEELEVVRPANLPEFLEKLEILAVPLSGNAYEFADFYDLAVSDLASLAGVQVEPKPEIEDLPRGCIWGGASA